MIKILMQLAAALLLLPISSLFCIGIMTIVFIPAMLIIILPGGYSLYVAWWLCIQSGSIPFKQIPSYIWPGVAFGIIIWLLAFKVTEHSQGFNIKDWEGALLFGGLPTLSGIISLLLIKFNGSKAAEAPSD